MIHEEMCHAVDTLFSSNPEYLVLSHNELVRLKRDVYDPLYVAALVQRSPVCPEFSIYDAYYFMRIHTAIAHGHIAYGYCEFGHTPAANNLAEENNQRLATLANKPLRAVFEPAGADGDGYVAWASPLIMEQQTLQRSSMLVEVPSAAVPLEVGTTAIMTTFLHLKQSGLARWPYGQTRVWVFVPTYGRWDG